uniref:Uncharacterized protein n=1 Tax=viral metagenome TaxID=1070528 RepID=A0A6C0EDF0_9ZZZZ
MYIFQFLLSDIFGKYYYDDKSYNHNNLYKFIK